VAKSLGEVGGRRVGCRCAPHGRVLIMQAMPPTNGLPARTPELIYAPERDMAFSNDRCFLCGISLTTKNRTDEHVVPAWVQREFALSNERIVLLNGTSMPYRQLTIPCCSICNGTYLAPIEQRVADAYRAGRAGFEALDRWDIYSWLGKIFYGLLFRERLLPIDRTGQTPGRIVPPELLAMFFTHHLLLQRVRGVVDCDGFPASVFLFDAQETTKSRRQNFDLKDSLEAPAIAVRLGPVAIFAALQDFGALETIRMPQWDIARRLALAPVQFAEVFALGVHAATSWAGRVRLDITERSDKVYARVISRENAFVNADHVNYVDILSGSLDWPPEQVTDEHGYPLTWLVADDGSPRTLSEDDAF
jgi:hypothetical protein